MVYFRVKPEYDNYPRYKYNSAGRPVEHGILVGNELYTEKELNKLSNNRNKFEKVEIKKTETYWFFGSRFGFGRGMTHTEESEVE